MVDAGKAKLGGEGALALARKAERVVAVKGKKRVTLDMRARPPDEEVLGALLGPTGGLRAPTMRVGKTLVVGFDPEIYADVLGTGKA